MPRQWEPWTIEDEQKAVDLRQAGKTVAEISCLLNRKPSSLAHKLMRLQAGKPRQLRHLTKIDLRRLRRLYPSADWPTLERAFPGRSRETLGQAARRLGLNRPRSDEDLPGLAAIQKLTETEIAYLAGIVDGEGSILRRPNGQAELSIGNTSAALIEWLSKKIGGHIFFQPTGGGLGKKPFWRWRLGRSRTVAALIERMRPYLLIKS